MQLTSYISNSARFRAIAYPLAVLAAGLLIGVSELSYKESNGRLLQLVEQGKARVQLLEAVRLVVDAESGKRGYVLVGGKEYLEPYRQARSQAELRFREIRETYRELGDETSLKHLDNVVKTVDAKFSEMTEVMKRFDEGDRDGAIEIVKSGIGREMMDDLRKEVNLLVQDQNAQIAVGVKQVFDTMLLSRIGVASLTVLSLLVLVMFMRQAAAAQAAREEQQVVLARERDRLESEVIRRTQDIRELAQHMQTVREDERAALARELHDELGALLTAAKLDVARIKPKMKQQTPDLLPRLEHLTETLNSGIALKRRIIEDLRPSTLSSLGLVPALEIQCSEFSDRSGIPVDTCFEQIRTDAAGDLTLFRVLQESLTNIAKYAQASQVSVVLELADDGIRLCIQDNGVGFDASLNRAGHHGLRGMRFRVEAANGRFEVQSAVGEGTRICATLPASIARPANTPPVQIA